MDRKVDDRATRETLLLRRPWLARGLGLRSTPSFRSGQEFVDCRKYELSEKEQLLKVQLEDVDPAHIFPQIEG